MKVCVCVCLPVRAAPRNERERRECDGESEKRCVAMSRREIMRESGAFASMRSHYAWETNASAAERMKVCVLV